MPGLEAIGRTRTHYLLVVFQRSRAIRTSKTFASTNAGSTVVVTELVLCSEGQFIYITPTDPRIAEFAKVN